MLALSAVERLSVCACSVQGSKLLYPLFSLAWMQRVHEDQDRTLTCLALQAFVEQELGRCGVEQAGPCHLQAHEQAVLAAECVQVCSRIRHTSLMLVHSSSRLH